MATFLVQGKDQTGEVKKPPPKKILKKGKKSYFDIVNRGKRFSIHTSDTMESV